MAGQEIEDIVIEQDSAGVGDDNLSTSSFQPEQPVDQKPSKPNALRKNWWIILVVLASLLLAFTTYTILNLGSQSLNSAITAPYASMSPLPTSTYYHFAAPDTNETTAINNECKQYYDAGYLGGLYSDTDAMPEPEIEIPEDCRESMEHGWENGRKSAGNQFKQANDSKRRADLFAITNAIYSYATENNGELPPGLSVYKQELGTGTGKLDLSESLKDYLEPIPFDPKTGNAESTGYTISQTLNFRLEIEAQSEVNPAQPITVTR